MNILHLEDDGPLREILAAALKAAQPTCEIHQFVQSDSAVQYAQEHAEVIDLFILDIRVPGSMNGLEVARRVRAMKCPGAIVVTSAYSPPSPELMKELRCEWYPKPWHIFETTAKLLSLVRKDTALVVQEAKPAEIETPAEVAITAPKPEEPKPSAVNIAPSSTTENVQPVNEAAAPSPKPEEPKPSAVNIVALSTTENVQPVNEAAAPSPKPEESKPTKPNPVETKDTPVE